MQTCCFDAFQCPVFLLNADSFQHHFSSSPILAVINLICSLICMRAPHDLMLCHNATSLKMMPLVSINKVPPDYMTNEDGTVKARKKNVIKNREATYFSKNLFGIKHTLYDTRNRNVC